MKNGRKFIDITNNTIFWHLLYFCNDNINKFNFFAELKFYTTNSKRNSNSFEFLLLFLYILRYFSNTSNASFLISCVTSVQRFSYIPCSVFPDAADRQNDSRCYVRRQSFPVSAYVHHLDIRIPKETKSVLLKPKKGRT